jgi:hypothetical protein
MGWKEADDGSAMKVTNTEETLKTERISSTETPHEHEITKVDKPSGTVVEVTVGKNDTDGYRKPKE